MSGAGISWTRKSCQICQQMRMLLLVAVIATAAFVSAFYLPKWIAGKNDYHKNFAVKSASTQLVGDSYLINAKLNMDFSPAVIEALQNGVTIPIVIEVEVVEQNLWLNSIVKEALKHFELRFHALTNLYKIKSIESKTEYSFASREEAMELLGNIHNANLINVSQLNKDKHHVVKLRVFLDIWQLPEVLRPVASLSSDWHLKSPWHSWYLN